VVAKYQKSEVWPGVWQVVNSLVPYAAVWCLMYFALPVSWWLSLREQRPEFLRGEVSADLLAADLPLLRVVMEKAYGGWDQAAKRGWNWSRWFDDWAKLLADKKGQFLPVRVALGPFGDLMDFQLDNHSGPVGRGVPVDELVAAFRRGTALRIARSASLTDSPVLNTSATSGASTTTTDFARARRANRLGRAFA